MSHMVSTTAALLFCYQNTNMQECIANKQYYDQLNNLYKNQLAIAIYY
jgi:hypothetical protein